MAGVERMTFGEVVRGVLEDGHADVVREALVWFCRPLMEGEVAELIGAGLGERSEDRATWRNGYRPRRWGTRAGEIELQIPKLRQGSYFPSFLEPRRRSEQALLAVRPARLRWHLRCPSRAEGAIAKVLGAPSQRCTVHFLRDCIGHARKDEHGLLGALIRPTLTPTAAKRRATGCRRRSPPGQPGSGRRGAGREGAGCGRCGHLLSYNGRALCCLYART